MGEKREISDNKFSPIRKIDKNTAGEDMSHYRNILIAIDLSDESEKVLKKAEVLAVLNETECHVIHVVEPTTSIVSSGLAGGFVSYDTASFDKSVLEAAQESMSELCVKRNIPLSNQHVVMGYPKQEIHQMAEKINADLIMIGSHGRHGMQLLLGSTANAVLHGAKCDVLAIRV